MTDLLVLAVCALIAWPIYRYAEMDRQIQALRLGRRRQWSR